MSEEFEVKGDMLSEDESTKALASKCYQATYKAQDASTKTKYFRGERLLEAAERASEMVENDPFNELVEVKLLGTLN